MQFIKECSDYLASHLVLKVVSRYYDFAMNKHALYSLISIKWVLFMVLRVYIVLKFGAHFAHNHLAPYSKTSYATVIMLTFTYRDETDDESIVWLCSDIRHQKV